ncbi:MAG: hypothetical protein ACETWR_17445 [Anaerolineae bacterium]
MVRGGVPCPAGTDGIRHAGPHLRPLLLLRQALWTGVGRIVARLFKKGQEEEFGQTASQKAVMLLLAIVLLLPLVGGIVSLVVGYSALRLVLLGALVALLVAGLAPHPRLVCSHCKLAEKGCCPIGKLVLRNP